MKVLGDIAGLPPEVSARLDDIVEVAPGVQKRYGDCTIDEVAGHIEACNEAVMNHREIAELLGTVLAEGIAVPAALRARLSALGEDGSGPRLIAVRDELRKLIASERP